MSGLDNFWNFKTMLVKRDSTIDGYEAEQDTVFRSNVPILTVVQLSASQLYQSNQEDVTDKAFEPAVRDEKFDGELQNLQQLTIPELQELRRKIALHSHPDLKFKVGFSNNYDLMSQANSLIDDEIKRRL